MAAAVAATPTLDEPPFTMGHFPFLQGITDKLILSTADQSVNTARRHFDARGYTTPT